MASAPTFKQHKMRAIKHHVQAYCSQPISLVHTDPRLTWTWIPCKYISVVATVESLNEVICRVLKLGDESGAVDKMASL